MMFQPCGDACEDIKTHEDGEGFDACVKTAKGFVKKCVDDAEYGTCGQLGARPCVLDGMDECMDRCFCSNNDGVVSFQISTIFIGSYICN